MVYKGILHQMGSGESIESDRVIVVHRPGYSRIRKQRVRYDGWMRRSFIRIGDTEIRNVLLRPNWDEYLEEAIGQEVELSVGGPPGQTQSSHPVAALRTPRAGLLKPSNAYLAGGFVRALIMSFVAALLVGGIATLLSWLVLGRVIGAVIGSSSTGALIGFFLGLLFIPAIFIKEVRFTYNWTRQCSALN
jgi:hypothetical protein